METKEEIIKETWTEPTIYVINFKETRGGASPYALEDTKGTVSTLPG